MSMQIIEGDLIALAKAGEFDVIIHGCNCQCQMGKGIALTIKKQFPEVYAADCATEKGDKKKLGTYSFTEVSVNDTKFSIINAYTQFHWRGNGVKADYEAIRKVFKSIKNKFPNKSIGYPLIGAGLAGGNWGEISQIINEELKGENHFLVKFKPR